MLEEIIGQPPDPVPKKPGKIQEPVKTYPSPLSYSRRKDGRPYFSPFDMLANNLSGIIPPSVLKGVVTEMQAALPELRKAASTKKPLGKSK